MIKFLLFIVVSFVALFVSAVYIGRNLIPDDERIFLKQIADSIGLKTKPLESNRSLRKRIMRKRENERKNDGIKILD